MNHNHGLDRGKIIACGVIALAGSLSVIFLLFLFSGVDISTFDRTAFVSILSLSSAFLWGVLLCRNC
ncbi:MAG: hypothetical protein K6A05_07480 [Lachnospiraceae bacterium]|nr:hypothetical protein [Lachnospiraceae bacterium]